MEPLHSPVWYRVAALRPRLAPDAVLHRHRIRGECWSVVRDPATGRVHRLAAPASDFVALLDGARTVEEAWETTLARWGDEAPSQEDAIHVLATLHAAGLLRGDVPADTEALLRRSEREVAGERRSRWQPLAFRVPLFDPDALLTRLDPWLRRAFSRGGAALGAALVLAAAVAALRHGPEVAEAGRALLEPRGMLALWFGYPVVKALHELGHAAAVKRWGGEVREVGILFLVLLPLPYVDASAASVFPEKGRRMAVGAAGIAVELFLAALATFVWLAAEPGLVRDFACATMWIGGASSLLVNGNPLLRFDGYHVLADAIEIPNLAPRASAYSAAWARLRILGVDEPPLPRTAPGERPWLLGYAVASSVYGLMLLSLVALHLAERFFFLGVALALFAVATRVVLPAARGVAALLADPLVQERRGRAAAGAIAGLGAAALLLFAVPLPLRTIGDGIVWLPEEAHVRAAADGFVVEVLASPMQEVEVGEVLLRVRDAARDARIRTLAGEVTERERRARAAAEAGEERVVADIAREQLAQARAALAHAEERASAAWIRSPARGVFVPRDGRDLVGTFVREGDVVAYVVGARAATVRVLVPQEDAALLRRRAREAEVRLAHDVATVLPAEVVRESPAATDRLPTPALGTAAGGPVAVDPADPEGLRTRERHFELELLLPDAAARWPGERAHVRFDHGAEPVAWRAWRAVRRAFLRQLGV